MRFGAVWTLLLLFMVHMHFIISMLFDCSKLPALPGIMGAICILYFLIFICLFVLTKTNVFWPRFCVLEVLWTLNLCLEIHNSPVFPTVKHLLTKQCSLCLLKPDSLIVLGNKQFNKCKIQTDHLQYYHTRNVVIVFTWSVTSLYISEIIPIWNCLLMFCTLCWYLRFYIINMT